MTTPQRRRHGRGLTLIELMMAIAVAAILLALAAPSFTQAIAKNRLSTAAGELTGALQLARAEAIRNNRRVVLCRSADASTCSSGGDWPGWIIFVDTDGDGVRDSNEPVVKAGTIDGPVQALPSAAVTASGQRFTFRGDGLARASNGQSLLAGTVALCLPANGSAAQNVRDVSLAFGSRTTVRKRAAASCETPSDTL